MGSQPIQGKEAIANFYRQAVEVVNSLTLAVALLHLLQDEAYRDHFSAYI